MKMGKKDDFFGIILLVGYLTLAMKAKYLVAAFSVAAFSGLSTVVATAETQSDTAAATAAANETVKVFIVTAKGGG